MIVKEYKTPSGVTIKFNNDAYADKSKSEKAELRTAIDKTISALLLKKVG